MLPFHRGGVQSAAQAHRGYNSTKENTLGARGRGRPADCHPRNLTAEGAAAREHSQVRVQPPGDAVRLLDGASTLSAHLPSPRLRDVVHAEKRLYLVFDFVDLDLKRHFDSCPAAAKDKQVIKARPFFTGCGRMTAASQLWRSSTARSSRRRASGLTGASFPPIIRGTCTKSSRAWRSATHIGANPSFSARHACGDR